MSIPPLVCSTPPPPDQCEDDKDPEEFDVPYGLSQEDEDENDEYGYGGFSSFNHLPTTYNKKPLEFKNEALIRTDYNEINKEIYVQCEDSKEAKQIVSEQVFITNDLNGSNLRSEEDVNIEDLDLKLADEVSTHPDVSNENNESESHHNTDLQELNIPNEYINSSQNNNDTRCIQDVVSPELEVNKTDVDVPKQAVNKDLEAFDIQYEEPCNTSPEGDSLSNNENLAHNFSNTLDDHLPSEDTLTSQTDNIEDLNNIHKDSVKEEEDVQPDDDFGDFDEFQSVRTVDNTSKVVETCENPWENADPNDAGFANFTANFDENNFDTEDSIPPLNSQENNQNESLIKDSLEEDDDFGDFDDFKSSTVQSTVETTEPTTEDSCHELPVLNLHSSDNDHQIMETITKMLASVFVEEIPETKEEFEGKLESFLSETWGHLRQTDERQPYIVNWNNSLGQKTLLKALCIDSRNILFGPKWSSSMPKFAAAMSNAPLQPVKPVSTSQAEVPIDKSSSKPTTWNDSFRSEGQDSCNADNENSAIKPGPTDLDVFEATVSKKPDKIYSSTLAVQPLRQINLPDTHIFTPTDSEIPRSKTIHYDSGPNVLLPQPVPENNHLPETSQNVNQLSSNTDDSEYWEFQDFKGSTDSKVSSEVVSQANVPKESNDEKFTVVNALPQQSIAYQTQLLQPIKVEPSMPTLNWPDPGEVKCAFDDFSDFVSISTNDTQERSAPQTEPPVILNEIALTDSPSDLIEKTKVVPELCKAKDDAFDDEFDTFKSAVPTTSSSTAHNFIVGTSSSTDFKFASPSSSIIKSDSISFPSISKSEASLQSMAYTSDIASNEPISFLQSNVLQPTQPTSSVKNTHNQQKSAQILQPLTLESFSQINWPSPGIDLQDLSRFNPVESLQSLKSENSSKNGSPVHAQKNSVQNQVLEDDMWGDFVSSKPKQAHSHPKPQPTVDDDEWTDFISSPSVKPQNGLSTISLNVHTYSNIQKTVQNKLSVKTKQPPLDIPSLNYITPKTNSNKTYNDKHFQNL